MMTRVTVLREEPASCFARDRPPTGVFGRENGILSFKPNGTVWIALVGMWLPASCDMQ